MAMHDQEVELFGEALNDDELANELDALVADDVMGEIADLGPAPVIKQQVAEAVEEEEEQIESKPKRQMMAA